MFLMRTHNPQYTRSEYHTQLAKMSIDKIFDLSAGVYFNFDNMMRVGSLSVLNCTVTRAHHSYTSFFPHIVVSFCERRCGPPSLASPLPILDTVPPRARTVDLPTAVLQERAPSTFSVTLTTSTAKTVEHCMQVFVAMNVYLVPVSRSSGPDNAPKVSRRLIARTCKVSRFARKLSTAPADLESRPRADTKGLGWG